MVGEVSTTDATGSADPGEPVATASTSEPAPRARRARGEPAGWRLAELFGLTGLAVAQPVLDIYAKNPLELISRQVEGWSVIVFALVVVAVPALVLFAIEQLVALASSPAARRVHAVFLALLAGVFVLQLIPAGPVLGFVAILVALTVAVGVWFGVQRVPALRRWLRFLAVAPVVFGLLFLATGPASELVWTQPPAAAALPADPDAPSIMVIVLDELPTSSLLDADGEIDAARFPNIASLAEQSTWYRNEATLGSWTSIAVPGILTGRYPVDADNRAHWSRYPENLFTLFADRYRIVAHESSTRLCPDSICPDASRPRMEAVGDLVGSAAGLWGGLVNPFEDVEVAFEPAGADMTKAETHRLAIDTAGSLAASPDPTLAYLHLSLPHQPWQLLASGQTTNAPSPPNGIAGNRWQDPMAAASAYQRHQLQLEFTDSVVGDVLDSLRSAGRYDDTMIVLAADHGASFRADHDQRAISDETIPDIGFPPLIVKEPGQTAGSVDLRPTQTIDILPTIAGAVGVDIPWEVDGVDLGTDDPLTDRTRRYFPVWIDDLSPGPDGSFVLPGEDLVDLVEASGRPVGSAAAVDALDGAPALAGGAAGDLAVRSGEAGGARIHGGAALGSLDLDAPELPVYVDIELDAAARDAAGDGPTAIAVAVNGTVAVTGVLGGPDGRHLWVVIPPARLRGGANELTVYRIDGDELIPLATSVD